jgi:hypothetical protein
VKLILAVLMRKLTKLSKPYKQHLIEDKTRKLDDIESGTFIPFKEALKIGLPHRHILDMTAAETFTTYLTLLAKINADSRPKLIYSNGMVMQIATFEDLAATMSLLDATNNPGLSPELQQWYQEIFMVVYNEEVSKQKDSEKDDKEPERQEVRIKTSDLIKKHKELSQSGKSRGGYKEENSKEILQKYLYPLINAGYVEDEKVEGVKAKLYRPVKDLKYSFYSFSDEKNIFPYKLKMKIERLEIFPTKEILELQISQSLKYSSKYTEKERLNFKLVDVNNDEISVNDLVDKYLCNPEDYFKYVGDENRNELDLKNKQEEKKDNTLEKAESEEHISNHENNNKLELSSINNENNRRNDSHTIQENVLLTNIEQIEHPKPIPPSLPLTKNKVLSIENVDREASSIEYVYDNDDDDEANEEDGSSQDVQSIL